MKILLVNSPNDLQEKTEDYEYSLAHACLAASLREAGHKVEVIHFINPNIDDTISKLKEKLKEFEPNFFGTSILTDNRNNAKLLYKTVKEINPKIYTVAGGVHATFMSKQILNTYAVDALIKGEGEKALLELIDSEMHKLTGCNITLNPKRTFKLDTFPIPAHDLYSSIIRAKHIAYLVTSRGCVNHPGCSFCCGQAYWNGCLSQRSAEKVVEEIRMLFQIDPDLKEIHFLDDEFLCNRIRVQKIFDLLEKENIRFRWICSARASSMNEEYLKYIKSKGCYCVHIGVESFSQKILDLAHKNVKVEKTCEVIKLCRKHDINPILMCIVGLPGETSETVNENIRIAQSIGEAIEPAITLVYPGTEVYELAKKAGQLTDDYWLTDKMAPLYTAEHSKARLLWWAYKTAILTHWTAGTLSSFLSRKLRLNRISTLFKKFFGGRSR